MNNSSCFVYVIGTLDIANHTNGRTYVGWSKDLASRIVKHNSGKGAKATRGRQWCLLYAERFFSRSEAMSREWYIKRDRKFRKTLLENWTI